MRKWLLVLLLLGFDRKGLGRADFMLLLTFAAFFIFAGNLARVEAVAAVSNTRDRAEKGNRMERNSGKDRS